MTNYHIGPHRTMWDHIRAHRTISDHMGPHRATSDHMGFGTTTPDSEIIWPNLFMHSLIVTYSNNTSHVGSMTGAV